ncbi:twin-arginine translocase TatA/TatE family subunit [Arcicella sp. LKC2W]|jgi:sec-independent protein translocase protein TatA|uniref:Sec-independent protein translocase protein TatA n=1 Tax=Arcicella aurantiaca TaxID=591202 RepID=A0A316EFI8_9BACT|nr:MULTISPECIES: twin-arginine translocase TatA/TatE family subunit [Arcicella]MEA5460530.1 twin-arginine translocase TatA/TatE family subunit [Arcicella sp. LKC2W]PWK29360.1 sec-independent protein translocase protein TatA [Arcicella aurantiaca]
MELTSIFLLLGNLGTGELVLIGMVVLLMFGGKKLPELMKGLGKGMKEFKDAQKDVQEQISKSLEDDTTK